MDPAGLASPAEHSAIKDSQAQSNVFTLANSAECQTCAKGGFVCEGYLTRLHWNTTVGEESRTPWSPGIAAGANGADRIRSPSQSQYIWNKQFPGYRTLTPQSTTSDCTERRASLFANYIPENPIIAASTTPLERHYLRHFLTYTTSVTRTNLKACMSSHSRYRRGIKRIEKYRSSHGRQRSRSPQRRSSCTSTDCGSMVN